MAYLAIRYAPSLSFAERLREMKSHLTAAIKARRIYAIMRNVKMLNVGAKKTKDQRVACHGAPQSEELPHGQHQSYLNWQ